ncbi:MAG TPA: hypothetical protein VFZ78_06870 [Flavisolibacter sp.]
MKPLFCLVLLTSICNYSSAQQKDSLPCPKIVLEGPAGGIVYDGNQAVVSVRPFKKEYRKSHPISYTWVVNNGTITGEKNKSTVHIDTKGLYGQKIVVAVVVNGMDAHCPSSETITIAVEKNRVIATQERVISKPASGRY